MEGLIIAMQGGNCPVQIEGTIDGRPFYFRARGEHWSLEIHPTADGGYLSWPEDDAEWRIGAEWGDGPFVAGWMPIETALAIVEAGCALWRVASKWEPSDPRDLEVANKVMADIKKAMDEA